MSSGYIKLYRSSLDDPLYFKEPFTKWQAWCDLILMAYYAPTDFFVRGIKVKGKRGCVYKGVMELTERWKWSRGKVERFIKYLVEDKKITVHANNVVNCMTIVNYDKYQQTEQGEGELFPVSEDVTLLKKELDEIKKRFEEQEKKKPSKKSPNPLITEGRKIFEERYEQLFGNAYYWQAKDAVAMESLTKKIMHSRSAKGLANGNEDVMSALGFLLASISDAWLLKNYSVTNINSKYNEIVAQAKAKHNGTTGEGMSRAEDAASVIASLAAKEDDDD